MNRRAFIAAMAAALTNVTLVSTSRPQTPNSRYRIGYLTPYRLGGPADRAFRQGMSDLGYVEGRDFVVEARSAELRFTELPRLAAELAAANVDVIVTATGTTALAAKRATSTIPIVMASSADAVPQGIVESLHRPGGNVTGLTMLSSELAPKRLALLKELLPNLRTAAALWCPRAAINHVELQHVQTAAAQLGIDMRPLEYRERPTSWRDAMGTLHAHRPDALVLLDCSSLPMAQIVEFASRSRLPTITPSKVAAHQGALLAYGPDALAMTRRSAIFVDRVLKGTKPADLPVEQPTKFELVINLKTARALGIAIPQSLLLRADEIIQ
jgi:putative ABC transport system substrate-binding protein